MKNPFLKYVMKEKKEDIFHSSMYGKAQSGEGIGAASSQGFMERMKIDKNRQHVKGYGDSKVVTEIRGEVLKAKTYTPPETKTAAKVDGPRRQLPKNPGISR